MPVTGKMKDGKGVLTCGGRGTKKFSIEYIDEKQIKVNSHICLMDIIFICLAVFGLIGMVIVFINGAIKEGVLCATGSIMLCSFPLLSHFLPWKRVEKVLKKDFACIREQ